MFSHARIWSAIDRLAHMAGLSTSGLARQAGLDPTTFNKSKRFAKDGRPRWPSTESLAKIGEVAGVDINAFLRLMEGGSERYTHGAFPPQSSVPVLGFAKAGVGGFFDDGGFPSGQGWEEVDLPSIAKDGDYALKISGDSMQPLFRDGDVIVVSPAQSVQHGDRVVVKTHSGEVMAKVLFKRSAQHVELLSFNPDHPTRLVKLKDVDWIARITWASQ